MLDRAVARCPIRLHLPLHHLDDVVGDLPAAIEALIDHRALLVELREVVPVEVRKSALSRIRQIDIRQFAARELIDLLPI